MTPEEQARAMLWEALTREMATWPRGFDPETDTKPERPQDWAAYRGDWVANAAVDALSALSREEQVRAALRKIAGMTDIEADFDGFEARRIAQDAIRSAPSSQRGD